MADDLSGSTLSDRHADEDAIRELLDRQVMGWDAGDPEAYASVFTADADYVTFLGSHYKGREAIAASYVPLFKKLLKGSRAWIQKSPTAVSDAHVALIQANAAVSKGARRRNRRNTRVNTSIAVRTDDPRGLAAVGSSRSHPVQS